MVDLIVTTYALSLTEEDECLVCGHTWQFCACCDVCGSTREDCYCDELDPS